MNTHLMIDFETLNTAPDAVVLSLGAVLFNREGEIGRHYWVFDLQQQIKYGRTIGAATLLWWMEQEESAKEIIRQATCEGKDALQWYRSFVSFLLEHNAPYTPRIWSHGADFDAPIFESLLSTLGKEPLWKYGSVRCYRTVKKLFDIEKDTAFSGTKHNALDDAIHQANAVRAWLNKNPEMDK